MARIRELDRLSVVDEHLGHWSLTDAVAPLVIAPGYGRPQLQAQRDAYHDLQELIAQLETDVSIGITARDSLFGLGPDDQGGVWLRLRQFKTMVVARLGTRHVLSRTVPNLGRITPQLYLDVVHRFIDHWERVNAALGASPLTLGSYALADLETRHDELSAKITEIDSKTAALRVHRQEREQLFGDETEELREETSIIARLSLYHAIIEVTFPGQPLADSLPAIFPASSSPTLPTFAYNWIAQPDGSVKLWYSAPTPALSEAVVVYLKEGVVEQTSAVTSTAPGSIPVHTFTDVTIVDEIDELELRNADSLTIARGTRDTALPEPA